MMIIPKQILFMSNVAKHLRGHLYALGELGLDKEEVEFFSEWIERVDALWTQRNADQPSVVNFATQAAPTPTEDPTQ